MTRVWDCRPPSGRVFTVHAMNYDMVGQECVEGECFDLAIYPPLTQFSLNEASVCQSDYVNAPLGDVPA